MEVVHGGRLLMVSGIPLHAEEKRVIEEMIDEEFPSVIARYLAVRYAQYNGGSRSTRTVQGYLRRVKAKRSKSV